MLTHPIVFQALELWPVNVRKKHMKNTAHLTVNFCRNAEIDQALNHKQEAGQAHNGVDLSRDIFRVGSSK